MNETVPMFVATIDHIVDRFGAWRPIVTGSLAINGERSPQYLTAVLPRYPSHELLSNLIHVQTGDIVNVTVDQGQLPSYVAAYLDSVVHLGRSVSGHPKCPCCGSGVVIADNVWCQQTQCVGRLASRLSYMGSPEALNIPELASHDLWVEVFRNMTMRDISFIFSEAEIRTIDPSIAPESVFTAIEGQVSWFRHQYAASATLTARPVMAGLVLRALSYPGLTSQHLHRIVDTAYRISPNIIEQTARWIATGEIEDVLGGYSGRSEITRYLALQLNPYLDEITTIGRILETGGY